MCSSFRVFFFVSISRAQHYWLCWFVAARIIVCASKRIYLDRKFAVCLAIDFVFYIKIVSKSRFEKWVSILMGIGWLCQWTFFLRLFGVLLGFVLSKMVAVYTPELVCGYTVFFIAGVFLSLSLFCALHVCTACRALIANNLWFKYFLIMRALFFSVVCPVEPRFHSIFSKQSLKLSMYHNLYIWHKASAKQITYNFNI